MSVLCEEKSVNYLLPIPRPLGRAQNYREKSDHLIEPPWQQYYYFRHNKINPQLLSWLLENKSLTQRLKNNSHHFRVEIVTLKWAMPLFSERKLLRVPMRSRAYIREVRLICENKPWVFARVVIPNKSLTRCNRKLLHLGTQPLGEVLFKDPTMQRSLFELALIKPECYYHSKAKAKSPALWARRSIFNFHSKPILVSEMFLDDFPWY